MWEGVGQRDSATEKFFSKTRGTGSKTAVTPIKTVSCVSHAVVGHTWDKVGQKSVGTVGQWDIGQFFAPRASK